MSDPTVADSLGRMLRADRDFRRYFVARIVSLGGAVVTVVALPVLVYRLSGSALLTASVTALEALPYLLFGLVAGALTDRWDRQRVMVSSDLVNAVLIGSIPLAWWLGALTVWHVLVVAFCAQAVFTFFDGANFGALPVLVGRERVAVASAGVWAVASVVEVVAPPAAATAIGVLGPANLLVVDALSFVASALAVRGISRALHDRDRHREPATVRSVLDDVREGLRFLLAHAGVRTMTLVGTLQSAAGGGFVALMVVWADRTLGIGTSGLRFGVLFGVWGIGGALAAVLLPRLLSWLGPEWLCLWALPASAVLGVLTALAPTWQLGALGLGCWGVAYSLVVVNSITYRQMVTPEPLLGRVNTTGRMLSWGLGWTGGALVAGLLATHAGTRAALVAMASLSLVAVLVAWTSPLRRASRPRRISV
ncbi:MFS transporter [Angustibacter luteus]|uniref:MFS transporter n=1 Tax=Angustibacter luteus TaxID=658456 RepID=A0ABW1JKX4_9ACTN